jgi:hypothetical protein
MLIPRLKQLLGVCKSLGTFNLLNPIDILELRLVWSNLNVLASGWRS